MKMMNTVIKLAEQTYDPEATRMIVNILKDKSPEYADYSFNLIDCLERMTNDILRIVYHSLSNNAPEKGADAVKYLLAENIEKIHDAMARDYDEDIERL